MNPILISSVVLIVLIISFRIYVINRRKREFRKRCEEAKESAHRIQQTTSNLLKQIHQSLNKGETPDKESITDFAQNPITRIKLYEALFAHGQEHLFPSEYSSHQALAESQLVYRMQHVHHLNGVPDEINFEKKITFESSGKEVTYLAFRLKMQASHPLSEHGWLSAVCGPYSNHHPPHTLAMGIHFDKLDEDTSVESFAHRVHTELYIEPEQPVKELLNLT